MCRVVVVKTLNSSIYSYIFLSIIFTRKYTKTQSNQIWKGRECKSSTFDLIVFFYTWVLVSLEGKLVIDTDINEVILY